MVRNSTHDVESGTSSNRKKGKTSLGLIIALAVALVAAIVFMSVFIVYQQKYVAAQNELALQNKTLEEEKEKVKAQKLKLKSLTELSGEMLDTATSERPDAEAVLMKRELKYGIIDAQDAEKKVYKHEDNDFNIMQFNMLADGLCGLYDDPEDPEFKGTFRYAMNKNNQHTLYWRYRLPLIIAEIIENKADIVTIQENDHPDAIESALNVRAKKDSKSEENIWKCEYVARTQSPIENMANLPFGKNKKDGSTICWDITKFTQDEKFEQEESAYPDYEITNENGLKEKLSNGNIYVAVKLNHTATEKKIVVVTTQLESVKTLTGENIRIHQMKELMKKMNEWKKNDSNIIFTSDLNAIPEQNARDLQIKENERHVIKSTYENILLEQFNLAGEWYCQQTETGKMDGDIYKAEFKDSSFTKTDSKKSYDITSSSHKFRMSIDETVYELRRTSEENMWISTDKNNKKELTCQKFTDNKPTTVVAGIFDLMQNFSGKTFYDSFSQKYVIDQYNTTTPTTITMKINDTDTWTITKTDDTYTATPTSAETKGSCILMGQSYLWRCENGLIGEQKLNFHMKWSQKLENTYKYNYPDVVYKYVTNFVTDAKTEKAEVDFVKTNILKSDEKFDSVVKDAKTKYIKHVNEIVDNIVAVAEEDKKNSTEMGLISSQKKLSLDQKEPLTVLSKSNPQTLSTEDYIFATKELTPVAHLSYFLDEMIATALATNVEGGAPSFNYPSNHVALMTRYRFA